MPNRSAPGAIKIAGRDALEGIDDTVEVVKHILPPSPPPKEAIHVFTVESPIGHLVCPAKCVIVRIAAWMESANNLELSLYNTDMINEEAQFSVLIPVIRGRQLIRRESFTFPELELLDVVTFRATKPTAFYLSVAFQEL